MQHCKGRRKGGGGGGNSLEIQCVHANCHNRQHEREIFNETNRLRNKFSNIFPKDYFMFYILPELLTFEK